MLKKTLKKKFHQSIIVVGAKQHNLKNISIEIPRNKLVVITGLSGSENPHCFRYYIRGRTEKIC